MMCCLVATDSGLPPSHIENTWSMKDLITYTAFKNYQNMSAEDRAKLDKPEGDLSQVLGFLDARVSESAE